MYVLPEILQIVKFKIATLIVLKKSWNILIEIFIMIRDFWKDRTFIFIFSSDPWKSIKRVLFVSSVSGIVTRKIIPILK